MIMISDAFIKNNVKVKEMIKFGIATRTIQVDLKHSLRNSGTRIVILWVVSIFTSTILQHTLDHDLLGPYFLWILSSTPSLYYLSYMKGRNIIFRLSQNRLQIGVTLLIDDK
jgi:hypothetical protein